MPARLSHYRETLHAAGQGLFYSLEIRNHPGNSLARVVYDCGTQSADHVLTEAISRFARNAKSVDLVVLSHLDKDHVSGLKELASSPGIRRVLLPYLPVHARIVLAASAPPDHRSFLLEPGGTLAEWFDGEILVMSPAEPAPQGEGSAGALEGEDAVRVLLERQVELDDAVRADYGGGSRTRVVTSSGRVAIHSFHELRFCCLNLPAAILDTLERRVARVFRVIGLDPSSADDAGNALSNRRIRKLLRKLYEKALAAHGLRKNDRLNRSSIVMLHRPCVDAGLVPETGLVVTEGALGIPWLRHLGRRAWHLSGLVFGDFNYDLDRADIHTQFGAFLGLVSLVSLPHHGGLASWHADLCSVVHQPAAMVASAGPHAGYPHPSPDAISDIHHAGHAFALADKKHAVIRDFLAPRP